MALILYDVLLSDLCLPILITDTKLSDRDDFVLDSPDVVAEVMNEYFQPRRKAEEHIWLISLNTRFKPIGIFELSKGTVDQAIITPREVFVRLLLTGATRFILVHNHTSGNTEPSNEDIKLTERLQHVGDLMHIKLADHIIMGDGYYSMCAHSLLNNSNKHRRK